MFIGALVVVSFERWKVNRRPLAETPAGNHALYWKLIFHLSTFATFYVLSALLFATPTPLSYSERELLVTPWFFLGLATVASLAWAAAPIKFWTAICLREKKSIAIAFIAGSAAWVFAYLSRNLWETLSDISLLVVHQLLLLFFDNVFIDIDQRLLGVGDFIVEVGQACSGYEGIGMITVFTSLYLYLFRRELQFPNALILLPIGILTIWIFNFLRIGALIAIGAQISPNIALNGFHSQAGWLSFLLVSMGLFAVAYKSHYFLSHANRGTRAKFHIQGNLAVSTLMPLTALFSAILITNAFSDQSAINWFYPIPVAAGLAALMYCWPQYRLRFPKIQPWPLLCGAAVFVVWIILHPNNPDLDNEMGSLLIQSGSAVSLAWITARVFGSVLIIPVVEELVFRGYLLSRLAKQDVHLTGPIPFSWLALILSSVVFGMLHQAWLAGIIAGFAYATLRYRSSDIWAPIIAHVVSNGLIALYVLTTGTWSLW